MADVAKLQQILNKLLKYTSKSLDNYDITTILPRGMRDEIYQQIIRKVNDIQYWLNEGEDQTVQIYDLAQSLLAKEVYGKGFAFGDTRQIQVQYTPEIGLPLYASSLENC